MNIFLGTFNEYYLMKIKKLCVPKKKVIFAFQVDTFWGRKQNKHFTGLCLKELFNPKSE
jgi:hypothetical protein